MRIIFFYVTTITSHPTLLTLTPSRCSPLHSSSSSSLIKLSFARRNASVFVNTAWRCSSSSSASHETAPYSATKTGSAFRSACSATSLSITAVRSFYPRRPLPRNIRGWWYSNWLEFWWHNFTSIRIKIWICVFYLYKSVFRMQHIIFTFFRISGVSFHQRVIPELSLDAFLSNLFIL
jgi:hypothetical protein